MINVITMVFLFISSFAVSKDTIVRVTNQREPRMRKLTSMIYLIPLIGTLIASYFIGYPIYVYIIGGSSLLALLMHSYRRGLK